MLYQLSSAPCTSFVEPTIDALLCASETNYSSILCCALTSPRRQLLRLSLHSHCTLGASCCAFLCALRSHLHPRRQLLRLSLRSHLILGASRCACLCALTCALGGYFVEPTMNPMSPEPACAFGFRSLNCTIDYGVSCCALVFNASSGDKYLICCCGGDDRSRSALAIERFLKLNFQ